MRKKGKCELRKEEKIFEKVLNEREGEDIGR